MVDNTLQLILQLAPDQFENLIFECVKSRGMRNVVWRTPGADGGRDIEGETFDTDLAGDTNARKWYVECKRYSSTLDWPTVRGKIAYAESNDADVLLVATTTNPTPQCETEIGKWNLAKRRPLIRFWRGYDLPNIIRGAPHIATMFGLAEDARVANSSLIPLAEIVTRAAQATYARIYFSNTDISPVETVAAIAELFSVRLKDIRDFGRPARGPSARNKQLFDWLTVEGDLGDWEDTSLRAVLSFLKYEYQAASAQLKSDGENLSVILQDTRKECAEGLPRDREILSYWSRISTRAIAKDKWVLEKLPYVE